MNAFTGWYRRGRSLLLVPLLGLLPGLAAPRGGLAQAPPSADLVARGKYVFGATGGCGCHTDEGARSTAAVGSTRALRDRVLVEHHARPGDGDRRLDRRADHHRDPTRPAAQRRAADPGASLYGVQRHGRGGPPGAGRVPPDRAAGEAAQDRRRRSPCRCSRACSCRPGSRPSRRARRRRPPRPPRGWRAGSTWSARSATAASATRRAAMTMATDNSRFLAGDPQGPGGRPGSQHHARQGHRAHVVRGGDRGLSRDREQAGR